MEEWKGLAPRKWTGGIKTFGGANVIREVKTEVRGMKYIPEKPSGVMKEWQPSIRIIKNPITTTSKPSGVKSIPEPIPKSTPRPEARHVRPATTGHWEFRSTLKQVEVNGVNAKDRQSGHFSFEKGLGMK